MKSLRKVEKWRKNAGFYRRKCTEDEAALRSEIRANLRVTRVVVIKCFCSLSDPHDHDGLYTRHLLSEGSCCQLLLVPTVIPMTPSSINLSFLVADPIIRHHPISCPSVTPLRTDQPVYLFLPSPQLTVCTTATGQMGWRGQLKRVNCEIRPDRPNGPIGPIGESKIPASTCPTKVGPILSHGPLVGTKAQTCPSRFKKLVLQAWEACPASLRGLFSRSERLAQQVCEACSTRKGGRTSLL